MTDRASNVVGVLFIVAGVVFLLEALGLYTFAPRVLWPALLIGAGLAVIGSSNRISNR